MLQLQSPSNKKFAVQEVISGALLKAFVDGGAPLQVDRLKRLHMALTSHRSISNYAQISQTDAEALAKEARAALDSIGKPKAVKPAKAPAKAKKPPAAAVSQPQARLFADAWPESFNYIAERFPHRPYVSNNLDFGQEIRPIASALIFRYIQYNNPAADHLLIIDYDCPNHADGSPGPDVNEIWKLKGLPRPAWVSRTPDSRKGHLAWALATPVCTTSCAKIRPVEYLARIEQGFRKAISGDQAYNGNLTKNPVHQAWTVTWIESKAYALDELASAVDIKRYTNKDKGKQLEEIEAVGLGRKVLSFHRARFWAYSAVGQYWGVGYEAWHEAVLSQLEGINRTFKEPLQFGYLKSIAKSISRWVWTRFTPLTKHQMVIATHAPAMQALRGARKGAKRRDELMPRLLALKASGAKQAEMAAALGVAQSVICDWLKRDSKLSEAYIR